MPFQAKTPLLEPFPSFSDAECILRSRTVGSRLWYLQVQPAWGCPFILWALTRKSVASILGGMDRGRWSRRNIPRWSFERKTRNGSNTRTRREPIVPLICVAGMKEAMNGPDTVLLDGPIYPGLFSFRMRQFCLPTLSCGIHSVLHICDPELFRASNSKETTDRNDIDFLSL
jgi:hypothetical protein